MDKNICKGCSSYYYNDMDHVSINEECTLNPKTDTDECPCLTCLVKAVCTSDHEDCDKYRDFCLKQIPEGNQEGVEIPCKSCVMYDKCLTYIINKIRLDANLPDEDEWEVIETMDYEIDIYLNILYALQKRCKILEDYFPFNVVSRDNYMKLPVYRNIVMDEEVWEDRDQDLFDFFRVDLKSVSEDQKKHSE